ncbi:flippase [Flammeovirga aprica]|uniref:Flippase n=1 Tax=Flammeovirga aprica JL-4 TaxID=694437 RepID=A0A7X9XD89_9BACT|nr:flippase [Flammeovirga aprica]NME72550.1 flippase [Flammeovirga aprica JL-4]
MKIKEKIINWYQKDGVSSILKNINWLVLDRIIRMVGGLLINAWVSRYLGPKNIGIWDFSVSVTSFFLIFSSLGIERVAIKNFVEVSHEKNIQNFSTLLSLRIIISIISFLGAGFLLQYYAENDGEKIIIGWLVASSILIQVTEVITFDFQANLLSKFTVISKITGFILASVAKVYFIINDYDLTYFIGAYLLELFIGSVLLLYHYFKLRKPVYFSFSKKLFNEYLHSFLPLLLSAFAYTVYTQIDQVMIGRMLGDESLGVYSRAVKLFMISTAIYTILASSLFPELTKQWKKGIESLNSSYERISSMLTGISYVGVLFTWILADLIIDILYGKAFAGAALNLKILMISAIFQYNGGMRGNYLILTNQKNIIMISSFCSMGLNILLNYILIPTYGTNGAAFASIFTVFFTTFLLNFLFKKTIIIGKLQFRSYFFIYFIKKFLSKK